MEGTRGSSENRPSFMDPRPVPQALFEPRPLPRSDSFDNNGFQNPQIESNDSTRVSTPSGERDLEKYEDDEPPLKKDAHKHLTYMGYDINDPNRPKLGLRQRLHHFTWAWWTLIMSTGGLSLLIYVQPYQFPGLRQIGLVIYIITVILYALTISALLARFFLFPGDLKASICHEREGFFFPTFFLSTATLITSTYRYAIPENDVTLNWAVQVAFWSYVAVTLTLAVGQYSFVFRAHNLEVKTMMPTWILPIFPVMLSGTIAATIAETQPEAMSVAIVYTGLACQGLGMSVAFLMYAHMVVRLISFGLPSREHRAGLFMNVGPPAFTCLAFIGMSRGLPDGFDFDNNGVLDIHFVRQMALLGGVYLWGLSLWWWGVAILAVIQGRPKYFHLGWWASVFPNTGFTLATITLGNAINSKIVLDFGVFMTVCIFITYFFVLYHHIRAVIVQDIMYPGRDEDVVDH
ncbi:malic acid transport protein [Diaporthe helianthi]|uniref:Malic acid transport protein n=1 Tax=Diaporthe helianthi TaxID=158607 RepID=A0A2P5HHT9_DIAHE|nr:malic acid transport protein [Diaporthe helianthi]